MNGFYGFSFIFNLTTNHEPKSVFIGLVLSNNAIVLSINDVDLIINVIDLTLSNASQPFCTCFSALLPRPSRFSKNGSSSIRWLSP